MQLSVRELRTTESSNVIIFYLGWISTTGGAAACVFVPGQWVTPRTLPQIGLLIGTGACRNFPILSFCLGMLTLVFSVTSHL